MIKLFSQPLAFVLLCVLGVVVHLYLFINPLGAQIIEEGSSLYYWINSLINTLTQGSYYIRLLLFVFLGIVQAWGVNTLGSRFGITGEKNYLAGMAYLLLLGLLGTACFLTPSFFAVFFIILVLFRLFQAYNKEAFRYVFDTGFYTGVAALFYPPVIFMLVPLFIGVLNIRLFNWKEWITIVIGAMIPFYLLEAYHYLVFGQLLPLKEMFGLQADWGAWGTLLTLPWVLHLGILLVVSLLSVGYMQTQLLKSDLRSRKFLIALTWFLIGLLLIAVFLGRIDSGALLLAALPLALLLGYFFRYFHKRLWSEILIGGLLVSMFLIQFLF